MFSKERIKNIKKSQLEICSIGGNEQWIKQVIKWSYLDSVGFIAITSEGEKFIRKNQQNFYIIFYGTGKMKQAIGMFVLLNIIPDQRLQDHVKTKAGFAIKELDFFYIVPEFREYGIGSLVMDEIKQISKNAGSSLIQLQTLYPRINSFYHKNGAHFVCDSRYLDEETGVSHHSSVMTIKL